MARIRTIKPTHMADKELPKISLQAHLLWVLSWCHSDDEGIFENDPLLIKSNLFPRRTDVHTEQIILWLNQLVLSRFIIPFKHNNVNYYIHRTFKINQKIDKPQVSKIDSDTIQRVFSEYSTKDPRTLVSVEYSRVEYGSSKGEEVENLSFLPNDDFLTYDIEEYLLKNKVQFEAIIIGAQKTEKEALLVLKKFHYWNQQKENYPKKTQSLIAGYKTWLINEKTNKNGTYKGFDPSSAHIETKSAGDFGNL